MTSMESEMLGQGGASTPSPRHRPAPADPRFAEQLTMQIADIHVAMLTTVAPDGSLHSRPMATLEPAVRDGEIWFVTTDDSSPATEVSAEHEVNLAYADPARRRYVSLAGTASIVRDPERTRHAWQPGMKAWFPGAADDPRLVLLRVRVHTARNWDAHGGCMATIGPEPHATPAADTPPPSRDVAAIEEKMRHGR